MKIFRNRKGNDMKAYKVIYRHGHFIDVITQKRLIPVQGSEYMISADENAFNSEDLKFKIGKACDSEEKAAQVEKIYGRGYFEKIMNKDDRLFFRLGYSIVEKGDESHQYIFVCRLLEDLYLGLKFGKQGDEEKHWGLANCQCVLEECLRGGLLLTEKIPAKSLNELFRNTVQFYFRLQHSGAANALTTFYQYKPGMNINFNEAFSKKYVGLYLLREGFVENRRKKAEL